MNRVVQMHYYPLGEEEVPEEQKLASTRAMWALGVGAALAAGLMLDVRDKEINRLTPIGVGALAALAIWFRP